MRRGLRLVELPGEFVEVERRFAVRGVFRPPFGERRGRLDHGFRLWRMLDWRRMLAWLLLRVDRLQLQGRQFREDRARKAGLHPAFASCRRRGRFGRLRMNHPGQGRRSLRLGLGLGDLVDPRQTKPSQRRDVFGFGGRGRGLERKLFELGGLQRGLVERTRFKLGRIEFRLRRLCRSIRSGGQATAGDRARAARPPRQARRPLASSSAALDAEEEISRSWRRTKPKAMSTRPAQNPIVPEITIGGPRSTRI